MGEIIRKIFGTIGEVLGAEFGTDIGRFETTFIVFWAAFACIMIFSFLYIKEMRKFNLIAIPILTFIVFIVSATGIFAVYFKYQPNLPL